MSNIPAFPLNTPKWHESVSDAGLENPDFTMGMTLRDYFAAKAMQGIVYNADAFWSGAAPLAYQYADAMMKAREA